MKPSISRVEVFDVLCAQASFDSKIGSPTSHRHLPMLSGERPCLLPQGGRSSSASCSLLVFQASFHSLPEFMNFKLFGFGPFWWQI